MSRDHNAFGYSSGSSWRNAGQTQRKTSTSITYRPDALWVDLFTTKRNRFYWWLLFVMRIKRYQSVSRQQPKTVEKEIERKILRALIYQAVLSIDWWNHSWNGVLCIFMQMNWRSRHILVRIGLLFFWRLNERCVVKSNKNHIVFRLFPWNRLVFHYVHYTHISLQELQTKQRNLSWSIFNNKTYTHHNPIGPFDAPTNSNGKCIYSVGWSFVYHVNLSSHYDFCISITFFKLLESFRDW